jgi:3-hydroxyisobutyrate dehydrogenase-like beta-hydroxyacid dehydrogenase
MTTRVGLIGLGNAGGAMLQALSAHAGVTVHDRDAARFGEVSQTCQHAPVVAGSAAQVAEAADLVILSLPTPAASLAVAEEIRASVGIGKTVVESSTVAPEDVEALHDLLAPTGARVIDAPLVGGVHKLAEGKAVFLIGASEADAGAAGEVLSRIAGEVFYLGARGGGMRAKLIVNAVAHAVYVVLVEAGALAAAQDVPLPVLRRLLERESGLLRPLTHRFNQRLQDRDFAGGMSTANARKDSALILDAARALGVPLFATSAAHGVYELALREGLGALDYASIGTLWEKWLGVSLGK